MRRTVFTGRRGLAPTLLTVVIVWALAAVLMLTGTLLAAKSIKKDVVVITPEVGDIKQDTKNVEIALKVRKVSAEIDKALKPLSGELMATLSTAKKINTVAKSILGHAGQINDVAGAINGNVLQIGSTVNGISANANEIFSNVREINSSVRGINSDALSINSTANGINSDVRSILERGRGILENVRTIDGRVAGINNRAERARGVVIPIKNDLDKVLGLVGIINTNANGIDCANAIMGASCSRGARRGDPRRLARALGVHKVQRPKALKVKVIRPEPRRRAVSDPGRNKTPAVRLPDLKPTVAEQLTKRLDAASAIARTVKSDVDAVFHLAQSTAAARARALGLG